jgi:hypothetical protein
MRNLLKAVLITGILFFGLSPYSYGSIINGNFSNGLDGWTTDYLDLQYNSVPPTPGLETSVNGAGQAVLQTQGIGSGIGVVTLYQSFTFPVLASTLSFDIGFQRLGTDTGGVPETIPDFLWVYYLDNDQNMAAKSFVGADVNGFYDPNDSSIALALMDLGNGLFRFSTGVQDLAGRSGTLYFDLYDQDDGFYSAARADNVTISTAVPEPGTWLFLVFGLAGLIMAGRKKLLISSR